MFLFYIPEIALNDTSLWVEAKLCLCIINNQSQSSYWDNYQAEINFISFIKNAHAIYFKQNGESRYY